jgi:hypothetical protein
VEELPLGEMGCLATLFWPNGVWLNHLQMVGSGLVPPFKYIWGWPNYSKKKKKKPNCGVAKPLPVAFFSYEVFSFFILFYFYLIKYIFVI